MLLYLLSDDTKMNSFRILSRFTPFQSFNYQTIVHVRERFMVRLVYGRPYHALPFLPRTTSHTMHQCRQERGGRVVVHGLGKCMVWASPLLPSPTSPTVHYHLSRTASHAIPLLPRITSHALLQCVVQEVVRGRRGCAWLEQCTVCPTMFYLSYHEVNNLNHFCLSLLSLAINNNFTRSLLQVKYIY